MYFFELYVPSQSCKGWIVHYLLYLYMQKEKKSKLAKNLRTLRESKRLSQSDLAREVDSTRSRIASYELGKAEPNAMTLARLAYFFKVNLQSLITEDLGENVELTHDSRQGQSLDPGQDKVINWYLRRNQQHRREVEGLTHLYRYRQVMIDSKGQGYQAMATDFEKLLQSTQSLLDLNHELIRELSQVEAKEHEGSKSKNNYC